MFGTVIRRGESWQRRGWLLTRFALDRKQMVWPLPGNTAVCTLWSESLWHSFTWIQPRRRSRSSAGSFHLCHCHCEKIPWVQLVVWKFPMEIPPSFGRWQTDHCEDFGRHEGRVELSLEAWGWDPQRSWQVAIASCATLEVVLLPGNHDLRRGEKVYWSPWSTWTCSQLDSSSSIYVGVWRCLQRTSTGWDETCYQQGHLTRANPSSGNQECQQQILCFWDRGCQTIGCAQHHPGQFHQAIHLWFIAKFGYGHWIEQVQCLCQVGDTFSPFHGAQRTEHVVCAEDNAGLHCQFLVGSTCEIGNGSLVVCYEGSNH